MTGYPQPPGDTSGRVLDACLHLLDRQVLDVNRVPIAVVDDLELTGLTLDEPIAPDTPAPSVGALLSGPVLGTRIFGGRPPRSRVHRIPWSSIFEIGTAIRLAVKGAALDVTWTERWVRDRVIGRIPGAGHDPE